MDNHNKVAALSGLAGSWLILLGSSASAQTITTAAAAARSCVIPADAPPAMSFRCMIDPATGAAVVVVASFGGGYPAAAAVRTSAPIGATASQPHAEIIRIARTDDPPPSHAAPSMSSVTQAPAVREIADTAQQVANSAKQRAAAADDAAKAQQALADQAKSHAADAQDAATTAAGATTKADAQKNLDKAKGAAGATDSAANSAGGGKTGGVDGIYLGTGLAVSFNLGSERTDDVKFIKNGSSVLAQIQKSQDVNIGLLGEVHYLFKDRFLTRATAASDILPNLVLCGPWAFVKLNSDETTGCGPLAVAALTSDGSNTATQFGLGWALGLGGSSTTKPGIGLGVGFLVEPSNKVVDYTIVDRATNTVKPAFADGVLAGTTSVLVSRPTYSWFVMVSKAFN